MFFFLVGGGGVVVVDRWTGQVVYRAVWYFILTSIKTRHILVLYGIDFYHLRCQVSSVTVTKARWCMVQGARCSVLDGDSHEIDV
jgi:hypothetical protein